MDKNVVCLRVNNPILTKKRKLTGMSVKQLKYYIKGLRTQKKKMLKRHDKETQVPFDVGMKLTINHINEIQSIATEQSRVAKHTHKVVLKERGKK